MGEYWIPTNVTKKQFVHPHKMGDGLKLGEWMGRKSATLRRIEQLIAKGRWSNNDDIRAFSDYGSEIQMRGRLTDGVFNQDGACTAPKATKTLATTTVVRKMKKLKNG